MKRLALRQCGGAALVELVVVTPLLVLFFAAVSELGWAMHQYDVLTCATRDGVRFAAGQAAAAIGSVYLDPNLVSQTRNLVVYGNAAGTGAPVLPGFAPAQVTVTAPDSAHVSVQATYQYEPLFAVFPFWSSSVQLQMHSSVVMTAL